jgi:hypothetical protein
MSILFSVFYVNAIVQPKLILFLYETVFILITHWYNY